MPLVLEVAAGLRSEITIFGADYPTPDGTCIRDYVHVCDLAEANVAALDRLFDGSAGVACNLGSARGYSVHEVIETARRVTGRPIPARVGPRRPGDASSLVASNARAFVQLGWRPQYPDLETMVAHAWAFLRRNCC